MPLIIDLNLQKGKINLEQEFIEGYLKFREVTDLTQDRVLGVSLDLIQ